LNGNTIFATKGNWSKFILALKLDSKKKQRGQYSRNEVQPEMTLNKKRKGQYIPLKMRINGAYTDEFNVKSI
jgi:hypothetical protein